MKVVIVNGSARGKKGITHRLLGAFEKEHTERST